MSDRVVPLLTGDAVREWTGYDLRQLTAHLEDRGRADAMHRLLALETVAHRNAWFEAQESHDQAGQYLADVQRASRLAADDPGLQCRYALVLSSLRSSALPHRLLVAAHLSGTWSLAKVLNDVLLHPEPEQAAILVDLAPHLEPEGVELARDIASRLLSPTDRARAMSALAGFPAVPARAPGAAGADRSDTRAELEELRAVEDEWSRAAGLSSLAPRAPLSLLGKYLDAVDAIADPHSRTRALLGVVPRLEEDLLPRALGVLAGVLERARPPATSARDTRYVTFGPDRTDGLRVVPLTSWREDAEHACAEALGGFAPYLPPRLRPMARRIAEQLAAPLRARALPQLTPFLPRPSGLLGWRLLRRRAPPRSSPGALAATLAEIRAAPAPRIPPYCGKDLLDRAPFRPDGPGQALLELLPHLPAELLPNALATAEALALAREREAALMALLPLLPDALRGDALRAAGRLPAASSRARVAAAAAAAGITEAPAPELLALVESVGDPGTLAEALVQWATRWPDSCGPRVWAVAWEIADPGERARVLARIAPRLPGAWLRAEFAAARRIGDEDARGSAAACLATPGARPRRPNPAPTATEGPADPRAALASALATRDPRSQARALAALAPHLPGPLHADAVDAARRIEVATYRAEALVGLALRAPPDRRPAEVREALAAARAVPRPSYRAEALAELAPGLPDSDSVLSAALAEALRDPEKVERTLTMVRLAPRLPATLLPTALATVESAGASPLADEGLANLTQRLAERGLLDEALRALRAISEPETRAAAWEQLAPRLPLDRLAEGWAIAETESPSGARIRAALVERWAELADDAREPALALFQERLPQVTEGQARAEVLRVVGELWPVVRALAGERATGELREAIDAVGRWWP